MFITILIATYITTVSSSEEYYEFYEGGFYYIDKKQCKFSIKLLKAIFLGNLQSYAHYVPYEDILRFKPIIRAIGSVPINGDKIYETDFVIFTKQDEIIQMNSGVFGVSNKKIVLIAQILKEKAESMYDPFHVLEGLALPEESYYRYIDKQYRKAMKKRNEKKFKN